MKNSKSLTTAISSSIASLNNQISQKTQDEAVAIIQDSIRIVGQQVPIVMSGQVVIDGHKRLAACKNLNIAPKIVQETAARNDPLAIWTSLNWSRTHLSQNERSLIVSELYRLRPTTADGKKLTQEQICKNLGISADTVGRVIEAQTLAAEQGKTEEVMERLKRGDSPRQIVRDLDGEKIVRLNLKTNCDTNLKLAHELHEMAESNLEYSVIYADPPWAEACPTVKYQMMPTGKAGDEPNQDGTYPTICSMAGDIKKLTAKEAVLWLWTTSSLLQNGLDVMEAWGFKYTTMIVWAKDHHNPSKGAVLPKHELILVGKIQNENGEVRGEDQDIVLVGKHGAGLGKGQKQTQSWIELPVRKYAHSEKPEEFAEAAEQLYPTQAKLELFARRERAGWTCWGNESDGKALVEAKARSGGYHSNKSATAGMAKHRGWKPGKRVVQPTTVPSAPSDQAPRLYETSGEFNRTKNVLLNPGI